MADLAWLGLAGLEVAWGSVLKQTVKNTTGVVAAEVGTGKWLRVREVGVENHDIIIVFIIQSERACACGRIDGQFKGLRAQPCCATYDSV